MTDKELRKLRKIDLIEMLYYMRREIDDLTAENKKLNERLDMFISKAAAGVRLEDSEKADE